MYLWWVGVLLAAGLATLLGLLLRRATAGGRRSSLPSGPPTSSSGLASPPDSVAAAGPTKIAFDLRMLIQNRTRPFAERAQSQGLRFHVDIPANVPQWVRGDPARIVLVVTNLLDNALKFTSEGAVCLEVILTSGASRGPRLRLNVHDTGVGIDAETLARVLESEATTGPAGARGLAVSRRLVALMDGTMGAESEPRGGSTFWFSVPVEIIVPARSMRPKRLYKPAAAGIVATRPLLPKASIPGIRLLIVEANPAHQVAALWGVRALGYVADVVSSGQAASEAWQRTPYDLVLLDSAIRDETVARIRRFESGCVPIITMSLADDAHAAVDGHLTRPVCLIELARTLDHWLGAGGSAYTNEARSGSFSLPV